MTRFLGLDISKSKTGCALYDDQRSLASIEVRSFRTEGTGPAGEIYDFANRLVPILKEWKPDFAVIEKPLDNIQPHIKKGKADLAGQAPDEVTINARTALILNRLFGGALVALYGFRIPFEAVTIETWRKGFLGYGRKKGMKREDYKRAAKERCALLKIPVSNQDEAEAVGIAFYGPTAKREWEFVNGRMRSAA